MKETFNLTYLGLFPLGKSPGGKGMGIKMKYIQDQDCNGCGACMNVCPTGCISMGRDEEGFEIPQIDEIKCIHCDKCRKVCPVVHKRYTSANVPIAYAMRLKDKDKLRRSSSGGAFVLFAEYFIENGGAVVGCGLDSDLQVRHMVCTTTEELEYLKHSKYVQSSMGYTYRDVKKRLDKGQLVLFSGVPCQIEALKGFLGKDYHNLYTIDLLCHGVPSDMVWNAYLDDMGRANISNIYFRGKPRGWRYWDMQIEYNDGREAVSIPFENDSFCQSYLTNRNHRYSCHRCRFRNVLYKASDATIGDFWKIEFVNRKMDGDIGTSLLLIHTQKMKDLFKILFNQCDFAEVDVWAGVSGNFGALGHNVEPDRDRQNFYGNLKLYGYAKAAEIYKTDVFRRNCSGGGIKGRIKKAFPFLYTAVEYDRFIKRKRFLRMSYEEWMREEFDKLQEPYLEVE